MSTLTRSEVPESVFLETAEASNGNTNRRAGGGRRLLNQVLIFVSLVGSIGFVYFAAVRPAVSAQRTSTCKQHLTQMGQAFHAFHEAQGAFPRPAILSRDGRPLLSWRVALLPHLGHESLYRRFHLDEPWDSPHNRELIDEMPLVFSCPAADASGLPGRTGYRVVVGPKSELGSVNTMFEPSRGVDIREVLDGTSNTLMVGETQEVIPWTKPDDLTLSEAPSIPVFGSGHPGGFHAMLADGSVRFIKFTVAATIIRSILTINGGEVVTSD